MSESIPIGIVIAIVCSIVVILAVWVLPRKQIIPVEETTDEKLQLSHDMNNELADWLIRLLDKEENGLLTRTAIFDIAYSNMLLKEKEQEDK